MKKQITYAPKGVLMIVILLFIFMGPVRLSGQHIRVNSYANQTEIKAPGSVTLIDGFYIPAGKNVRIFTMPDFKECVPFTGVPSSNQNYVSTKVFKVRDVKATNIDSARTVCEVNQTVQYFDGLGRPLQTVTVQGSPGFRDLVQPLVYDAFGREAVKYLPYVSPLAGSNGSFKPGAVTAQAAFYNNPVAHTAPGVTQITDAAFAETRFEASPLNRVLEQGAPGSSWQLSAGHTQRIEYRSNDTLTSYSTTGFAVRLYHADQVNGIGHEHERILSGTGYYNANELYLTISKDENWKTTDVKAGTVEEYKDKEGRVVLKRTFSTTEILSTYYVYDDFGNLSFVLPPGANPDASTVPDQTTLNAYCYQYRYDGRKRLIEKRIPGKGWEELIYNKLDQIVLSRDAVQAGKTIPEWVFIKYDALGRVVITGLYKSADSRSTLQGIVNSQTVLWETPGTSGIGYSSMAFPQSFTDYHVVNYFDNYDFPGNNFGLPNTGLGQVLAPRTKGLQTGRYVYLLGSTTKYLTVNFYDAEGRNIQNKSENHLGGNDITDNSYNFAGELVTSTRIHTGASGPATIIANRFEYDHMGRKLATIEDINNKGEVVLNKLSYNEIGQLQKKELHSTDNGSSYLQSTAYTYNERGWLKNSTSNQFSFQLNYNDADGVVPQYNGNIGNQLWGMGNNPDVNKFNYNYDPLNRLKSAISTGIVMKEEITYDIMGNINTLSRDGGTANKYNYTGNQLSTVNNITTTAYAYDANGNAKIDGRTGMSLTYNLLNLPLTAAKPGVNVSYVYDALGRKLSKTNIIGANTSVRHYINGIEYNGNTIDVIHTEEGIARNNGGAYSYEYNLTDHLGNVRYTFGKDPSSPLIPLIERLQSDDYYAFGKRKSSGSPVSLNNKYLYNGKELQDELGSLNEEGQYDYGARFYDPVIGRWNVIDPMSGLYMSESPYAFAGNSPATFVDEGGLFKINAQFARQYPTLTRMLKYYLPMLKDNKVVRDAFTKITGMGNLEFDQMVSYGSGPWITPTRPELSNARNWNDPAYSDGGSEYDPLRHPDELIISKTKLESLERAFKQASISRNGNELGFQMFVTSLTIMHEATHYGYFKKSGGKPETTELGAQFEKAAFQQFSYNGTATGAMDTGSMQNYYKANKSSTSMIGMSLIPNLGGFNFNVLFLKEVPPPPANRYFENPKPVIK